MTPLSTCSWTRWQSNSICLVHLWNIGLDAIWIVAWLFQYIVIGNLTSNFISSGSCVIYISLHDVFAMALYSAFALDQDTTLCFLLLLRTLNVNLGCLLPFFLFDLNQLTLPLWYIDRSLKHMSKSSQVTIPHFFINRGTHFLQQKWPC